MGGFYARQNMIETLVSMKIKCIANKRKHHYHQVNEQKHDFLKMKIWVSRSIISCEVSEGKINTFSYYNLVTEAKKGNLITLSTSQHVLLKTK